jgi:transposase
MWTSQAVVELIQLVVGVAMTEQGVGLWLRRHGFTPQRPARRACEQQPAAVRAWLDEPQHRRAGPGRRRAERRSCG